MNKFVKLPLFLGGICLAFCTSLAVVVNICQPRIEEETKRKESQAYLRLYDGITSDDIIDITADYDFEKYPQIKKLVKIVEEEAVKSYVYSLTTKDPQSGTLSFLLGIDATEHKVDGYAVVSNNNSGYGGLFEKTDAVKDALIKYGEGEGSFYRASGATKTEKVMKDAVEQAFLHYKDNFMGGNE